MSARIKVGHYPADRFGPESWWWVLVTPDGYVITDGIRATWDEAVAAAQEAARERRLPLSLATHPLAEEAS